MCLLRTRLPRPKPAWRDHPSAVKASGAGPSPYCPANALLMLGRHGIRSSMSCRRANSARPVAAENLAVIHDAALRWGSPRAPARSASSRNMNSIVRPSAPVRRSSSRVRRKPRRLRYSRMKPLLSFLYRRVLGAPPRRERSKGPEISSLEGFDPERRSIASRAEAARLDRVTLRRAIPAGSLPFFRCHSVAIAGVFCGSFCPFVAPVPRSVTAREVREVAGKVVVAPTGFEPVFQP